MKYFKYNFLKRNKKGQGTLEFGLCSLTFMLLTLGMFDMAKLGITYIENNFNLSNAVSNTVQNSNYKNSIGNNIRNELTTSTGKNFFCTEFNGRNSCQGRTNEAGSDGTTKPVEPLKITDLEVRYKVANNANLKDGLPAGTLICANITMKYDLLYSQILKTGSLKIRNTSCNVLEFSGASPNSTNGAI